MKRKGTKTFVNCHTSIRIMSLVTLSGMAAFDIHSGGPGCLRCSLASDLFASMTILLTVPSAREDLKASFFEAVSGMTFLLAVKVLHSEVVIPACCLVMITFLLTDTSRKYRRIRSLFRPESIWIDISDYSSMLYRVVVLSIMLIYNTLCVLFDCGVIPAALASVLYVILYARAYSGHTFMIPARMEKMIREIARGNIRAYISDDPQEQDRITTLYGKVLHYMETRQPFLNDQFDINDLAAAVYTNRAYLSRAINLCSGKNFRQFVNYYRVNYALELLEKDLRLKVVELAVMSGFHSVVTFNMAFKLNMHETPSDYIQRMKVNRLRLPSSPQGQEQ